MQKLLGLIDSPGFAGARSTAKRCGGLIESPGLAGARSTAKRCGGLIVVVLVVAAGSGSARAQEKKGGGDKGGGTAKVKVYDFSGDTIEGDLIRPEGTTVDTRDFAKYSSLIRIRKHFIPEIIKSAEDL